MPERRILVVDDEKETLDILEKKLRAQQFSVLKAATAKEALDQIQKSPPDLILMDIVLPDMEGSEAVRLLHEDPLTKDIPVIFLSGIVSKEEGTARPEINVGGRLYRAIAKPCTLSELLAGIRRELGE